MLSRRSLPCLALAFALGGTGAFSSSPANAFCLNPLYQKPTYQRLKPLGDLLSKGEGDYNAVNRGRAGDTPGGIRRLTGKNFDQFTVKQVIAMQRRWLYAVGRYQFIPSTLRFAVNVSSVRLDDKFNEQTQDRLLAALVLHKRPAVGAYLRGDHDLIGWALDELAREWASVEYRNGSGYYDHVGGNRAHITRQEAWEVLQMIKRTWLVDQGRLS